MLFAKSELGTILDEMLTYKTKLMFENQEVFDFWVSQMRLVREAYNLVSEVAFAERLPLQLKAFHHRMYRMERERFPGLPAQMCVKVYKQVLANYRTTKANGHTPEKPLVMRNPAVRLDKRLYSGMTRTSVRLASGNGSRRGVARFLTYPKFDKLASRYRMCDPVLKFDEHRGEFYACIPFLVPDTTPCDGDALGVDLGLRRLATLSDGTAIVDREYLARGRRIRHNKRVLQRHRKGSHSARRKLAKLRRKERNASRDMCHHVANAILSRPASVIVMEDLSGIKRDTARTPDGRLRGRHNNALSQIPFYTLKSILSYKAPLRGWRVETVSPEFTSQMDCRTGSRDGCVRRGCRFLAADGRVFDADWNAAYNIRNRYAKRPASFSLPLDGRLNLVGRRRQDANGGVARPPCKLTASAVGI